MDKIELLGSACFSHGPYTFYKAVKVNNGRVLRLGNFFLTKLWTDTDLVSIGELQLLWIDSRGSNQPLASLRLYFLPENTPDGRRDTHGEDEVLTISEKVVVHVHDLVTWLAPNLEWSWGREVTFPITPLPKSEDRSIKSDQISPQVLTDPGIDFSDVDKQQKSQENETISASCQDDQHAKVVVLSYPRYCRYRALLRRLEGAPTWLSSRVVAALGGFTAVPGTRVLFCRDTFDYPDLEGHELLCNHLAPKLKGRPRRKRKKRSVSPGESSNESEASVASTSRGSTTYLSTNSVLKPPLSSAVRRSERKISGDEQKFLTDVQSFMNSRGTPVGKMPLLGYRQIDLYLFYKKVQKLGGYDLVTGGRLWKSIYDEIGGNTGSTSAATITRRHYERLLLPYERHQKGEETKVRPVSRRSKSISDITVSEISEIPEMKLEKRSRTPPQLPMNGETTNLTSSTTITSITDISKISLSISTLPKMEKPKTEGKISSLRSVRVKPERLKSLNTIIATTTVSNSNNEPPSPPLSTGNSSTTLSTPGSTPSTTPTGGQPSNGLDRQINSPLMTQSTTPPISLTLTTVTPPPEKDFKTEIKSEKPLITAQGKENIPIFDKTQNRSATPEVIDLELEPDGVRDKLVIPSFKKRKLEILREGGLEVTAIDLDTHQSVIQSSVPSCNSKNDEKMLNQPKLISVTVTPDISHMLPSPNEVRELKSIKSGNLSVNLQPINSNNNNNDSNSNNNNNNNNNNCNNNINNSGNNSNSSLLQVYSPNSQSTDKIFVSPVLPNAQTLPPKVTQSRSIFSHNEKTVYGNPKEILTTPNCLLNTGGILDLTAQKIEKGERPFSRPNLEIVRVPVVPRPNVTNPDINSLTSSESNNHHHHHHHRPPVNHTSFNNYPPMLDSRTMASNNLEITLVSPKAKNSAQPLIRSSSHPIRPESRLRPNGKYPKMVESINPYSPRKVNPVIPNVPNLNHLNNNCFSPKTINPQIIRDKSERKKPIEMIRDHQRRISEGDANFKNFIDERRLQPTPTSIHQQHNSQKMPFSRQHSDSRRHSVPNLPTGFIPALPAGAGSSAGNVVPYSNGQLTSSNNKFIPPIMDPLYYPAVYNGPFPTSVQQQQQQNNLQPQRSNSVITSVAMQARQHMPIIPILQFTDYYKNFLIDEQLMQSTLPTTK